ncbi:MAG: DEAD/DEAH box helicase [Opitutus sp.]
MSPKARPPVVRSVKKPESLSALRAWLATFNEHTRERGEEYYSTGRVKRVGSDADHYVEASVQGEEELRSVTLFLTRGTWSSKCTCPVRLQCKHAYAAARSWLDTASSGGHDGADPTIISATPAPPPHPPLTRLTPTPAPRKVTFAGQWGPVLAEKLGRPLTEHETKRLGDLAALYNEFVQARGTIFPGALLRHGFEHTPPAGTPLYTPAFPGWWDRTTAPADPWALWQYIAYDYELAGRAIPEVFRPLTDTSAIRAVIHDRLMQQELATWRNALAAPGNSTNPRTNPVAGLIGLRARVNPEGGLSIEVRAGMGKTWKAPAHKWFAALAMARPSDFELLPPADAALADALAAELRMGADALRISPKSALPSEISESIFRTTAARAAVVLPDGRPFAIEPAPLIPEATVSVKARDRLDLRMVTPDGRDASRARLIVLHPEPLYVFEGKVWRGPPPVPATPLPTAALGDTRIMGRLRAAGLRLPSSLEGKVRHVVLRPLLKCWLTETGSEEDPTHFHARLLAHSDDPPCEQQWSGENGWQWTKTGAPPARRPEEPLLEFDTLEAQAVSARLAEFRLTWDGWAEAWTRYVPKAFPDEFIAWHATLPPGLTIEASAELAGLLGPPLKARMEFSAAPAEGTQRDWFDLTVALKVEDTTLKPDEIALLLKARGKWVRLAKKGWRRIELAEDANGVPAVTALDRLGLHADDVLTGGRTATHRLHALQLAAEAEAFAATDVNLATSLRERAATLTALPPPPLPPGLRATLRPYQQEGFHFLAHLSALGFGGVLADDMGLGKTVQALAWLLHLAAQKASAVSSDGTTPATPAPFRALIVCPKSVMHGWLTETERFAPGLTTTVFTPALASRPPTDVKVQLLVANYAQLRIQPEWFRAHTWDAIVLDEAQFVKNPSSQTAAIVRTLLTAHRLALTGTPIENRLLDLWSLFAFAQPGLLGAQASFRRQYPAEDPSATARLRRRVRHFLLRRTKAQVAPELPPRTEDEIVVDLEGAQRRLYDAELKRARAQLLGVDTNRALDAVRFNVLASLLRLRQICCHPALVSDAHADLPSAKLDALLERLEELRDEGQQVLVFSQFVTLLELIRTRLTGAGIAHLMLTGQTENRAELVDKFQSDRSQTVFLLSLKAAGFGLNLTAASYVILCDPWWNPAVEAQAIDRTHRIGQTQPVVAYRLVAADTVEQKILAMQREKAALAASVVQEESLANVLDLDSLRQILS